MKNKFNTLSKYIFDNSLKKYRKETVDGLFRSITAPLLTDRMFEACVLLNINDMNEKESILKRLAFSDLVIYSYNDKLSFINLQNTRIEDIWKSTEFAVILGQRYSAALIWDYKLSDKKDYTDVCLLYNSKIITEIAKKISQNSKVNLKDLIQKYTPDRRENIVLNKSISALAALLNDKNEEIIFNEFEKAGMVQTDDTLKTAESVAKKAKFIAHEIKNNLSIINLYSTIAEKRIGAVKTDSEVSDSLQNALKNILTASENISFLAGDLRCLSAPYMSEVNIKHIILNTADICGEKAKKAGVSINVSDFDDFIITVDKTKFQCALTNIIFNAIEACKEQCTIKIDCFSEDNFLKVFVKNNGEMIPEEIREKIFEPDFTTKIKGNGLGLDICRKQLELTGGKIELVSSDINETVFVIMLPF